MQHTQRLFLAIALLLTAFAASAQAQTAMRFKFKENEKLAYVIEQKTKSTMDLLGQKIESNLTATINLTWEVVKVDTKGDAQVKAKVTQSKMTLDSLVGMVSVDSNDKNGPTDAAGKLLGQVNKALATMEITATMLPTGEMKDIKVSEATIKAMKAIPSADQLGDLAHPDNFRDMLSSLIFPAEPVSKGKSWTYKSQSQSPEGKVNTEQVFTLEGQVEQDGAKLEKISLKPNITIDANPKAMVKVKSVKMSGYALFDNKTGRFVESNIDQTKVGKIDVMGLTLDNTSVQTTTIRLRGFSAEEKAAAAKAIASLKIDETEYVEKVAAKELLETIQGVGRTFNVERTYEPSITMTGAAKATDELNAKVESALSVTLGKKTTAKESVTLDGKDVTMINAVWIERYRRGSAVMGDGSTVEFLVKVGVRLKLEKAK